MAEITTKMCHPEPPESSVKNNAEQVYQVSKTVPLYTNAMILSFSCLHPAFQTEIVDLHVHDINYYVTQSSRVYIMNRVTCSENRSFSANGNSARMGASLMRLRSIT